MGIVSPFLTAVILLAQTRGRAFAPLRGEANGLIKNVSMPSWKERNPLRGWMTDASSD